MKTLKQLKETAKRIHANLEDNDTFVFLNFSKEGSYAKAVQWGIENGLTLSVMNDIEAMKYNDLPTLFGKPYGYLVETTGKTFFGDARACYVWFGVSGRGSDLDWQDRFGSGDGWFCFRKSSALDSQPSLDTLSLELSEAMDKVKEAGYIITKQF